jgi:5-methylcytosine-specific restriction enzyme subunit McrC
MPLQTKTILPLTEYVPAQFPPGAIPDALGQILWRNYDRKAGVVAVDFPSPKTEGQWQLTSRGWVGYIPLTQELGLALQPKMELENIFHMLEYAYRLESFCFLEGLTECQSLKDFYERLASVLAHRVLDRGRKGFYRAYLSETDRLPYVCGRVDMQQVVQTPWAVRLRCQYEEHTADIEENQILVWTLSRIARSGMCTERVLPTVRQAYRALQGFARPQPCSPQACVGRLYNRLSEDYKPLHALCRFFLEHSGPSHEVGERTMLPFLVNMARLYELFVAEWLKQHLPQDQVRLRAQERVTIGAEQALHFNIDLTLYDVETNRALCVLDTKYKVPEKPSSTDVSQVVTYAEIKGCQDAILIYPTLQNKPLDAPAGRIRVRSLAFSIDGDLEQAGQAFVQELLSSLGMGQTAHTRTG